MMAPDICRQEISVVTITALVGFPVLKDVAMYPCDSVCCEYFRHENMGNINVV